MSLFIDDCEKAQLPIESLLYQCFYQDSGGNIYLGVKQNAVDLTFQVNSESGSALANASVTINGETQVTNALGQTTFSIAPGTYAYSVTATNYITVNDNVTVTGDQTETVEMLISILRDGSTLIWYDIEALSTITKDGSNRVSDWADKLGSGRDLVQLNGADQPLYSTDGILFDGVSEFMKTAPFAWNQPEYVYMVFKDVSFIVGSRYYDGGGANTGYFRQLTAASVRLFAGNTITVDIGDQTGNTIITRLLFNGASSRFMVGTTNYVIGDVGANNMSGFTLASGGGGANFSNIEVKEVICRNVADSVPNSTIIYDYLKAKYGL